MGFRPEPRRYKLTFDGDLEGLEVRVKSLTVRKFAEMGEATDAELLAMLADALVEWNLEAEDGTPVPATLEGIESQDSNLITRLISAWRTALTSVPPTSPLRSQNGAADLDLAALSRSLPS